jgi:hypothetical protein
VEAHTTFVVRVVPETGAVGSLNVAIGIGSIVASLAFGSRPAVALLLSSATACWILLSPVRRGRPHRRVESEIPPLPARARIEPPLRTASRVAYWTLRAAAPAVPALLLSAFFDVAWLAAITGGGALAVGARILFRGWQAWTWERRWALVAYRDAPLWRGGELRFYGERAA